MTSALRGEGDSPKQGSVHGLLWTLSPKVDREKGLRKTINIWRTSCKYRPQSFYRCELRDVFEFGESLFCALTLLSAMVNGEETTFVGTQSSEELHVTVPGYQR